MLHGNNKSDAEIELAITEGFAKIVVDEPNERPASPKSPSVSASALA